MDSRANRKWRDQGCAVRPEGANGRSAVSTACAKFSGSFSFCKANPHAPYHSMSRYHQPLLYAPKSQQKLISKCQGGVSMSSIDQADFSPHYGSQQRRIRGARSADRASTAPGRRRYRQPGASRLGKTIDVPRGHIALLSPMERAILSSGKLRQFM